MKKNIIYYGHEMNSDQAALLQQAGYRVTAVTVPPIPKGKPVQLIWLSHVLEHSSSYIKAKQMLLACYNRLDNGGYVVIIAPDIHHWKEYFWSADWSHGFPTSMPRVEQLLNETGFSVYRTMHHTCTTTNSFFAWFLSLFFRIFIPINFFDYIFKCFFKKTFCHSFLYIFGLRQIYVIGKKPD